MGIDIRTMLLGPMDEVAETQDWFEDHIAESMSLRTEVSLTSMVTWSTGQPKRKELVVEVWIPAARWNSEVKQKVTKAILDNLTVTPGFYDGGSLKLWTGIGFMEISTTTGLVLGD